MQVLGRSRPELQVAIQVFVLSALCLLPGVFWELPTGKAIEGALRILDGQVPYRDFWSMYAPGQSYAIAGLYWIFGREVLVQGVAVVLINAASASVFYLLMRRIGSARNLSLMFVVLLVIMFWGVAPELTNYPPALLLLLLALDRVTRYLQGDGDIQLYWAGLCAGMAALFKHDVAAYMAMGICASFFLSWFHAGNQRPASWLNPISASLRLGVSALAIVLPCIAWLSWSAGIDAWQDLIVFPGTIYLKGADSDYASLLPPVVEFYNWLQDPGNLRKTASLVYSLSDWIKCNVPQYVFLVALWFLVFRSRFLGTISAATAILWLSCMPLYWFAAQPSTNTHLGTMAVLSFLLLAMVWQNLSIDSRRGGLQQLLAALILIYAAGVFDIAGRNDYKGND